jgi:hypothetical protein
MTEDKMLLQGNLQAVFDALYEMGAIDPVLAKDWAESLAEISRDPRRLERAIEAVNACEQRPTAIRQELGRFDERTLEYLAMEVAREYADYHGRTGLH